MTLPLYELMKVLEIIDTLLGSSNYASKKIIAQNVSHLPRGANNVLQSSCEHNTNVVNDVSPYASRLPQDLSSFIGMVQNSPTNQKVASNGEMS